jgi:endonuclease/exonuclease/phosphatase family metal-dependent hydrolase
MKFTWALKHYPFTPLLRGAAEGLAIFSPHVVDAAGHSEISDGRTKWSYKRRIAQWALVGRPDTSAYRVYNVHLSPANKASERRAEAVSVTEIVESHGDAPPAIVAGDFNDDTDSNIIFALPGVEHITPPKTNPADSPTQVLDHVLLPPEAREVTVTVPAGSAEWAELADHLPVTVRFALDWVTGDFT